MLSYLERFQRRKFRIHRNLVEANFDTVFSSVQSLTWVQFQPTLTLCNPMDCRTPDLPVRHQLLELTQTHVHRVGDVIQPSHPLSPPSPPASNLSQHQGLFQWVSSSLQVAKVLEFQLQHQSFQWIFRTDFLQDWLVWSPCSQRDSQESSPALQQHRLFNNYMYCLH